MVREVIEQSGTWRISLAPTPSHTTPNTTPNTKVGAKLTFSPVVRSADGPADGSTAPTARRGSGVRAGGTGGGGGESRGGGGGGGGRGGGGGGGNGRPSTTKGKVDRSVVGRFTAMLRALLPPLLLSITLYRVLPQRTNTYANTHAVRSSGRTREAPRPSPSPTRPRCPYHSCGTRCVRAGQNYPDILQPRQHFLKTSAGPFHLQLNIFYSIIKILFAKTFRLT